MSAPRIAHLGLMVVALGSAACTISTTTVHVKDTSKVSVESVDAKPIVAMGQTEGLAGKGEFFEPFHWVQYEIHAKRETNGAITLKCDVCDTTHLSLLDESGRTKETWSWRVAIAPETVTVSYQDDCMKRHRSFCDAETPVRLSIPKDDVVEVRRKVEPIRPIGYLMLGMSVLAIGGLTAITLSAHDSAPYTGVISLPFFALGGVGLWEILAPTKEQVWTPSQEGR